MKKFLPIFTIAMCFGFTSQKAMAAITSVADLCGTYSFSATKVSETEEYKDVFPTTFEVTVEKNVNVPNGVIIEGFAGSTNPMYGVADIAAKTVKVESMPAYGADNAIVFSNAAGVYPYSQTNGYANLTFSFDDEKNLSLGAYTIVTVNHSAASATLIASFKDAVGVPQASAPAEKINFAGTYKVTAANVYDYVNNASTTMTYDIVIAAGTEEGSYEISSIAGYENAMVTATAEGNVLTINLGYNFLTTGATYDLLGDASYSSDYSVAEGLTITYAEGAYTISDYSVWTAAWSQEGTTYARKLYIGGNTISEGPEQEEGSEEDKPAVPAVDFAGTYSAKAKNYYNYTTNKSGEVPFNLVIKAGTEKGTYEITSIAGYDNTMVTATAEGNVLTINLGYNFLTTGATYDLLGDASYSNDYSVAEGLTITCEDGVYTMIDFSVWTATWTSEGTTYARKEFFSGIELTKGTSAIEDIAADANAPVEYYNLQGVKVANPENGIFIKKQGSKATKIVL